MPAGRIARSSRAQPRRCPPADRRIRTCTRPAPTRRPSPGVCRPRGTAPRERLCRSRRQALPLWRRAGPVRSVRSLSAEALHVMQTLIATSSSLSGRACLMVRFGDADRIAIHSPLFPNVRRTGPRALSDSAGARIPPGCSPSGAPRPDASKAQPSDGRSPDSRVTAWIAAFPGSVPVASAKAIRSQLRGQRRNWIEPHRLPFSSSLAGRTIAGDATDQGDWGQPRKRAPTA